jgi:hypothetical protein
VLFRGHLQQYAGEECGLHFSDFVEVLSQLAVEVYSRPPHKDLYPSPEAKVEALFFKVGGKEGMGGLYALSLLLQRSQHLTYSFIRLIFFYFLY